MKLLIAASIGLWCCMLYINPFHASTWLALGTTMTFVLRPIGVYYRVGRIIPIEVIMMFIGFNFSLVFRTFSGKTYLLMILCRLLFYLIVWYDDTQYVYVTEEEEKVL